MANRPPRTIYDFLTDFLLFFKTCARKYKQFWCATIAKHMDKSKPWHNPPDNPDYYEWLRNKNVNKPLRFVASTASSALMQVLHGRLIIEAPKATKNHQGKLVFDSVHRSGWDIPATVAAIARAGFERPRPISKKENFPNGPVAWLMHNLGTGAVNRVRPSMRGVQKAFGQFIQNGEVVMVFDESKRIRQNARMVHPLAGTAILLAAQEGASVVGMGIAGLAAEDKKRPIGFGLPTVITFTEPLEVPYADGSRRAPLVAVRQLTPVLHDMMQAAQDRAYQIRDAHL